MQRSYFAIDVDTGGANYQKSRQANGSIKRIVWVPGAFDTGIGELVVAWSPSADTGDGVTLYSSTDTGVIQNKFTASLEDTGGSEYPGVGDEVTVTCKPKGATGKISAELWLYTDER